MNAVWPEDMEAFILKMANGRINKEMKAIERVQSLQPLLSARTHAYRTVRAGSNGLASLTNVSSFKLIKTGFKLNELREKGYKAYVDEFWGFETGETGGR